METVEAAKLISQNVDRILPARELLHTLKKRSSTSKEVVHRSLGTSRMGNSIDHYRINNGGIPTLWYGFPDPGEAVGGSSILAMILELQSKRNLLRQFDVDWHFVPCTNFDDQPLEGVSHEIVMKKVDQEIDWCVNNPRPETSALLSLNSEFKPAFTYPMHDEWHCHERIPVYFPVTPSLSRDVCDRIRNAVTGLGFEISTDCTDPDMGPGFSRMEVLAGDEFNNTTFNRFSENGVVFICEVYDLGMDKFQDLIAAQIACGLITLDACIRVAAEHNGT